jgi:GNAT superfamily N-acetyltransferase
MSLRFTINDAVESDALNRLFSRSWPEHLATDFAPLLQRALVYVCAYQQEELIGFVKIISDGGIHGFLLDPTIHPQHRRKGLGSILVNRAVAEAKRRGLEWIHVDYEPHLQSFYAACGFRPSAAGVLRL